MVVPEGVSGALDRSAEQGAKTQAYEQERRIAALHAAGNTAACSPMIEQLNQLALMKANGILINPEFAAAKAHSHGN